MKKAIKLFIVMLIGFSASAQTQMRHWFIAPERVNMQVTPPAPAPIPGAATPINMQVANGFYDNVGDLLFYIANTSVFDNNNTLLGNIPNGGSEVIIVPFGDNDQVTNCKLKFNIFTTSAGISQPVGLYQTVLDMNSYSLITNEIDNMPFGNEFGAIAVSRIFNQVRFLYFMTASGTTNAITGQINKLTINHNGNVTSNGILYPTPSLPNSNAGADIFSQELEISPDGRWLAWSSFHNANINGQFRYHFIALDPISPINPGGLDLTVAGGNPYHEFNINGTNFNNSNNGFRGIEFWQGNGATKLFMGAGNDGVFWENISIPFIQNPVPIAVTGSAGTNGFGFSQIEFAFNGKMYATSGLSTNNVGGFDPSVLNPSMQNYFTLSNPPEATWSGAMLYTLPDQIDGQDYSTITPVASAPTPTLNSYTQNASATWTYASGANPWGATADPVQVIDKITVDGNSTLIINGMKIKFSPQAGFIIKKGSKVILDGTTLTSNYIDECNVAYTWKGVKVEGDINTSQNATNGQGKITLMNNSVIEYAECAAKNWDGTNSNTTGGIIVANPGTVFRNNKVDVE